MKQFNNISKTKIQRTIREYLCRLRGLGLSQTDIAMYLNVTDRAIRKWESYETVPSLVKFCNLCKLCKELGA